MRKIALISPHNEPNYGTMFQAYALVKAIDKLGYKAEYLSYSNIKNKRLLSRLLNVIIHPNLILRRLKRNKNQKDIDNYSFFKSIEFSKSIKEFNSFFEKYIPHSNIVYNSKTILTLNSSNLYSKYIVGSDQTWSPYRYNKDSIYFLDFVNDNNLKNSYAPSIGTINIPDDFKKVLKNKLSSFNNISCREKTNCKVLEDILSKPVFHSIDPTLLLNAEDWDFISIPYTMPKEYILCYILGEKKCISDFAEKLSEYYKLPVFYIVTRPYYLDKKNIIRDIGPSQLLHIIKNSSYVITDSFHGTIFSINYNVNFYSFSKRENRLNKNDNDRILEVLKDFDLEMRFKNDNDFSFIEDINFLKPNRILEYERKKSFDYLKKIIE